MGSTYSPYLQQLQHEQIHQPQTKKHVPDDSSQLLLLLHRFFCLASLSFFGQKRKEQVDNFVGVHGPLLMVKGAGKGGVD